ncbi:hypothetical protein Hanom_Chr03g00224371 [Helianthus anomalus]
MPYCCDARSSFSFACSAYKKPYTHLESKDSSLRFGQFCNFHRKVCFSASSERFQILPISSGSLTPSIFLR